MVHLETRPMTSSDMPFGLGNFTKDERTGKLHSHDECGKCLGRGIYRDNFFHYCDCIFGEIEREKIMGYYKTVGKPFKKYGDTLLLNAYIIWKFYS